MATSREHVADRMSWAAGGPERRTPAPARGAWRAAWTLALVAVGFAPMVALHALDLWARPHYQFFPLILPGAAALAWRSCRGLGPLQPGPMWEALGWLALGWTLLALAVLFASPWLGTAAAATTLLVLAFAAGGRRLARALLPAWAFLWLGVALPRDLDLALIARLQSLVSLWAGQLLDVLRVEHVMSGNLVEVPGKRLFVDQACSGVYSLMVLTTASLFFALWTRPGWVKGAALLAATLFWVIAGNVARVVAVVWLDSVLGIDASKGWRHELVGATVFLGMVAMVASTWSLLGAVGAPAWLARLTGLLRGLGGPGGAEEPASGPTALPRLGRTWVGSPAVGAAFGLLLLPQLLLPSADWKDALTDSGAYRALFDDLDRTATPERVGGFLKSGFRTDRRDIHSSWGESSKVWAYSGGPSQLAASLDYPFVGWHDLVRCYEGQGWREVNRRVVDEGVPTLVSELVNTEGEFGHLVYAVFDRQGRPLTPPDSRDLIDAMGDRVKRRLFGGFDPRAENPLTHQVQVFLVRTGSPITATERERARQLFDRTREAVHRKATGRRKGGP